MFHNFCTLCTFQFIFIPSNKYRMVLKWPTGYLAVSCAKEWMSTSKLKLNPDKTEYIIFGSKRQRDKLNACFPIDILGRPLCPVDSIKNLGVWFDSDFSLSKYVQNVCKSCFIKLHDYRHVRQFLTHDASVLVANALASRRLDYCNSLFRSLSKLNLRKLQCIQNSAARILSNNSRYTSITPVLKKLHWLLVEQCTVFKTATLVYKFLHKFSLVFCSISFFLQQFL